MTAEDFVAESCRTPWILTYTGKKVNPLHLKIADIDIQDIAHHLATINRWVGALREPISVAQHSVHVSWLCDGTGFELEGLLHDASEAFLGDVTKWLKGSEKMQAYRHAESMAMHIIKSKFGLRDLPEVVDEADRLMVGIEASFGIADWQPMPGYDNPTPDVMRKSKFVGAWPWRTAKQQFLMRFAELTR